MASAINAKSITAPHIGTAIVAALNQTSALLYPLSGALMYGSKDFVLDSPEMPPENKYLISTQK